VQHDPAIVKLNLLHEGLVQLLAGKFSDWCANSMISWTEGIKLFMRFDPALWDITDHRMELLRGTATPTSTKHLTWKSCDPISMWLDNTSERSTTRVRDPAPCSVDSVPSGPQSWMCTPRKGKSKSSAQPTAPSTSVRGWLAGWHCRPGAGGRPSCCAGCLLPAACSPALLQQPCLPPAHGMCELC
jgi:hypothetical protein